MILGTKFCLAGMMASELQHRISAAWGKFHGLKRILLHKDASLLERLRAFDATVGSCFLWCCESWFLRAHEARLIQSTQNSMLWTIVAPRRAPNEDWIDWVKRATRKARTFADSAGIRWWLAAHNTAKLKWARRVVNGGQQTWAWHTLTWRDSMWQAIVDRTSKRYVKLSRKGPWTR